MKRTKGEARGLVLRDTWWAYEEYVVQEGYICPVVGAKLVEYDPWKRYRSAISSKRKEGRVRPPYEELIALVEEVEKLPSQMKDTDRNRFEELIISWCNRNGLLGIFSHENIKVRFEPNVGEGIGVKAKDSLNSNKMTQMGYVRRGPIWQSVARISSGTQPAGLVTDEGEFIPVGVGVFQQRFFPDLAGEPLSAAIFPEPHSRPFWKIYWENVHEFYMYAKNFVQAVKALTSLHRRKRDSMPTRTRKDYVADIHWLNRFLSSSSPVIDYNGGFEDTWRSSSLISMLSLMAYEDLVRGKALLYRCDECHRLFRAKQERRDDTGCFCGRNCRVNGFNRRKRSEKETGDV